MRASRPPPVRDLLAGFVEAAVDPVDVEQAIELRPESERATQRGQRCRPRRGGRANRPRAPTSIEGDEGHAVELVDVEAIAQRGPEPRHGFLEHVGLFRLGRFVAVEPPAEAEAEKDDERRRDMSRSKPGSTKAVQAERRGVALRNAWNHGHAGVPMKPSAMAKKARMASGIVMTVGFRDACARGRASSRRRRSRPGASYRTR